MERTLLETEWIMIGFSFGTFLFFLILWVSVPFWQETVNFAGFHAARILL
jgi:hypothetical protein